MSSIRARFFAGVVPCVLLFACGDTTSPPPADGSGQTAGVAGMMTAGGTGGSSGGAGTGGLSAGTSGAGGPSAGAAGTSGVSAGGAGAGGATAGASGAGANGGAGASGSAGAAVGGSSGAGAGGDAGAGASGGGAGGAAGGDAGSGGAGTSGASGSAGQAGSGGSAGSGYDPCPEDEPCRIMPFGDSITEGYPVNGGYRVPLFRLARAAGRSLTFVGSANNNGPTMVDGVTFPRDHEGHGGFTIEDVPARGANGIADFVEPSMQAYSPHIITLMIGTNDLNGNIEVGTAPQRLGALLDDIYEQDPDVLVILAQIVPTRTDGTNQTVQNYNAAMPDLVSSRAEAGRHIVLLDMYEAFTRDADYKTALLGDNLHPNEAGYARMAETWYDELEKYLH
jgi:lysophospholipase L1-like esterase